MCYGENNAAHCTAFINSQLAAHFKTASECAEFYDGFKPDAKQHRYSLALAEFHYGRHRTSKDLQDLVFYAVFDEPKVAFVCNHAALVDITISAGHYNPDYLKTFETMSSESAKNTSLDTARKFRYVVPVKTDGIGGRGTLIGMTNVEHTIGLVIFDYQKAELIEAESTDEKEKPALDFYLKAYLKFLQSAGCHVFFSLPNFSDEPEGRRLLIDHSLDIRQDDLKLLGITQIRGIDLDLVARYINTMWLKAAMMVGEQNGKPEDRITASIAEYSNAWTAHSGNVFYHLRFGQPEVTAVCDHEIIIHFVVDDVFFYGSEKLEGDAMYTFSDWRIALVIEFDYQQPEPEVQIVKLIVTTARYLHEFSEFGDALLGEIHEEVIACIQHVTTFIQHEYLNVLESAGYHIIYHHDTRWAIGGEGGEDLDVVFESDEAEWYRVSAADSKLISKTMAWRNIIQNSKIDMYDEITALSEAAINNYLRESAAVEESILARWTHQQFFDATFDAPTVRLRGDSGTAIVIFNLKQGTMKHLKNGEPVPEGETHPFETWRIAFEVSLKMVDHATLAEGFEWEGAFQTSEVVKEYQGNPDVEFKHLYLDFGKGSKIKFLHQLSRFDGLFLGEHKRSIDKVQAAVYYFRELYIPEFIKLGFHILHTIPVWKKRSPAYPYGVNDTHFHMYTSRGTAEQRASEQYGVSHSTIVIVGNCGEYGTPPLPSSFWSEWVAHSGRFASYGTVGISSKLFLNAKNGFLETLSGINSLTSIIPKFSGLTGGKWDLKLVGWSKHEDRMNSPCPFGLVQGNTSEDVLDYVWHCKDDWDYQHEHGHGDHHFESGVFKVTSETTNHLLIPTVFKSGTMEIKMYGEITLILNVTGDSDTYTSESRANWSASLFVHSEPSGLRASMTSYPVQIKVGEGKGADTALAHKPEQLLADALPKSVMLEGIEKQFAHFEKMWKSCYPGTRAYRLANPVFNRCGDLLFEVLPYAAPASSGGVDGEGASQTRIAPPARMNGITSPFNQPARRQRPRPGNGGRPANGNANPNV